MNNTGTLYTTALLVRAAATTVVSKMTQEKPIQQQFHSYGDSDISEILQINYFEDSIILSIDLFASSDISSNS